MLRGFFGNLIFAIIAPVLCGNHLNENSYHGLALGPWHINFPKAPLNPDDGGLLPSTSQHFTHANQ